MRVLAICLVATLAGPVAVAEYAWAVAIWPSGAEFRLEIAADPESQRRGYMDREHVAADEGMLFLSTAESPKSFWMKNCRVPLDLIFLDEEFRVVEIAAEQQPCPEVGECPSIHPMRFARYVLEVAGGSVRREALRVGDRVTVLAEPSIP